MIAGGGDSAVDWAISLSEVAAQVTVIHRRPKFRAAPESAARLDQPAADGKIELVVPYQLHGLDGDDGRLSAVIVSMPIAGAATPALILALVRPSGPAAIKRVPQNPRLDGDRLEQRLMVGGDTGMPLGWRSTHCYGDRARRW